MKILEVKDRFVAYYHSLGYDVLPRAPMLDNTIYYSDEGERFLCTIERGKRYLQQFIADSERKPLSVKQIVALQKMRGLPPLLTAKFLHEIYIPFRKN